MISYFGLSKDTDLTTSPLNTLEVVNLKIKTTYGEHVDRYFIHLSIYICCFCLVIQFLYIDICYESILDLKNENWYGGHESYVCYSKRYLFFLNFRGLRLLQIYRQNMNGPVVWHVF